MYRVFVGLVFIAGAAAVPFTDAYGKAGLSFELPLFLVWVVMMLLLALNAIPTGARGHMRRLGAALAYLFNFALSCGYAVAFHQGMNPQVAWVVAVICSVSCLYLLWYGRGPAQAAD